MLKTKKKLKNHVALVFDQSGSMGYIAQDALRLTNSLIRSLKESAREEDIPTTLTLIPFSDPPVKVAAFYNDIQKAEDLENYPVFNMTALFDATGLAVEKLEGMPDGDDPNTSFLVLVITDGQENVSRKYNARQFARVLQVKELHDRWTMTFQVPIGMKASLVNMGIPEGNVREWEATSKGVAETQTVTTASIGSYYQARSVGKTRLSTFFVKTDLSQLTARDLQKLQDLTPHFRTYTVDKEVPIRSFVEIKTGKPYVIGQAYYQLRKKEKVQADKRVLLKRKGEKGIWGGQEARDLIGLPMGADATVDPGNHADFDLFVESRSVNRKLSRGERLLVDITQTQAKQPTWQHNAT